MQKAGGKEARRQINLYKQKRVLAELATKY